MDFGTVSYIGNLSDVPIGELLVSLKRQKETGLLFLRRERVAKRLFFNQGEITRVDSSLIRESFVQACIDQGNLDFPAVIELLKEAVEKKTTPIAALMIRGDISGETIAQILFDLMKKRLKELFCWQQGNYAFYFDRKPKADGDLPSFKLPVEQVIYEGIRTCYSKDQLNTLILDELEDRLELKDDPATIQSRLELRTPETQLLRKIDGENSLERIIFSSRMSMKPTLSLLITLRTLRLLSQKETPQEPLEIPTDPTITTDEKNYAQRLIQTGPALLDLPPFQLLQIGRQFNDTDLRRGYYQLAQNYHQKKITAKFDKPVRELSNRIFERISDCFEALIAVEKARHDKSLEPFEELESKLFGAQTERMQAHLHHCEGKELIAQNNFSDALPLLDEACRLNPTDAEFKTTLAVCKMRLHQDNLSEIANEVIGDLRRSLAWDASQLATYLALGQAFFAIGDKSKAFANYQMALQGDPENKEAQQGVLQTREPFTLQADERSQFNETARLEIERRLQEFIDNTDEKTYFDVLGIGLNASSSDIRRAYFKLAKDFHPDKTSASGNSALAEKVFLTINRAYDVISSPKKRKYYEHTLRNKDREAQFHQSQRNMETEKKFQKAKSLLADNQPEEAYQLFKEADEEQEGSPVSKAYLGYSLFLKDFKTNPNVIHQTETLIQEALKLKPGYSEAYVLLGKIYRQINQTGKALTYFNKVLDFEPDNIEALREIRLINQRKTQMAANRLQPSNQPAKVEESKKGLLGSLFGKKK